jgi:hypothetical protein
LKHAFGTNRSLAKVAEGGTHDELRFKLVAHDGRRAVDLWRTGLGKRRPCQIFVFRWKQYDQSFMSDLKPAPELHRSGTGEDELHRPTVERPFRKLEVSEFFKNKGERR